MASSADTPAETSSDDETPTADLIRRAVEEASVGDEVELAINSYEWQSPLDVIDTDAAVEWDGQFDDDWWTRSIYLKATRTEYELAYSSIGDPEATLYRYEDGERGQKRGTVEHLALLTADEDLVLMRGSDTGSGDSYHLPDPENPTQPKCGASTKDSWWHKPRGVLPGWDLCERCDDSENESTDAETGTKTKTETETKDVAVALPDDVTPQDVRDAVAENKDDKYSGGGLATIGDVSDALGIRVQRLRPILCALDEYSDVREVYRERRGRDRR